MFHFNRQKEVRISKEQCEQFLSEQEALYKKITENLKTEQKEMYAHWSFHMEELLQTHQKKQDNVTDAVEDLLDEWSDRNQIAEEYKEQLMEEKQHNQHFLSLIQLLLVQNQLLQKEVIKIYAKDYQQQEAWKQQLELFEQQTQKAMAQCQLQLFGTEGDLIDGSYHQVLEALDTDEAKNRSKIAKIHEPGMLYQGKIIKKATITAYK